MAGFTKASRASFNGSAMVLAGPPDNAFLPGGDPTGPTGSPLKRAKVMHTTSSSIDTTAQYPQFGGKASDARVYDHGETTSFVPITTVVAMGDMTAYGAVYPVISLISAGTVLDAKHIKLPASNGYGVSTPMSKIEMPLPMVSDAVIFKHNGITTATFTVSVEGRAQINTAHLGAGYADWAVGDKLVWYPPSDQTDPATVWTLDRAATGVSQVHAVLYNQYVGSPAGEGYVMVFLISMP